MSKMPDEHGDRMKAYEAAAESYLDPRLPIYARIDGRSFSRFTRGMARPYDEAMSWAMIATAAGLVERTHARIAYTQSDEISLVFLADGDGSDILFSGRVQKLASVLAGLATALFTAEVARSPSLAPRLSKLPHFDCRVCQISTRVEAANMFAWRYKDARKNAISMAAFAVFSHRQLHGKHTGEMRKMLAGIGVDFDAYPAFFRHGTFVRRRTVLRDLSHDELARIPEAHRPTGPVTRSETAAVECGDFLAIANREAFIFDGADPEAASHD